MLVSRKYLCLSHREMRRSGFCSKTRPSEKPGKTKG